MLSRRGPTLCSVMVQILMSLMRAARSTPSPLIMSRKESKFDGVTTCNFQRNGLGYESLSQWSTHEIAPQYT